MVCVTFIFPGMDYQSSMLIHGCWHGIIIIVLVRGIRLLHRCQRCRNVRIIVPKTVTGFKCGLELVNVCRARQTNVQVGPTTTQLSHMIMVEYMTSLTYYPTMKS